MYSNSRTFETFGGPYQPRITHNTILGLSANILMKNIGRSQYKINNTWFRVVWFAGRETRNVSASRTTPDSSGPSSVPDSDAGSGCTGCCGVDLLPPPSHSYQSTTAPGRNETRGVVPQRLTTHTRATTHNDDNYYTSHANN